MSKNRQKTKKDSASTSPAEENPRGVEAAEEGQNPENEAAEVKLRDLDEHVQSLKQQNEELTDQMLRLRAEFENSRRRISRDAEQQVARANEELMTDLIAILDDFDLFLANAEESDVEPQIIAGAQMIRQKLYDALQRRGLECLEAEGKEFDPDIHEALMEQPSDEVEPGRVLHVQQPGYRLAGKLLRPSRVIIARQAGGQ